MKVYNKLFLFSLIVIGLTGCSKSNPTDDLKDKVEKRKGMVVGQVDPLPQFKERDTYFYQNINMRSPFDLTMIEKKKAADKVFTDVKPEEGRVKEELEAYDIDKFKMVGTMKKGNGELEAIIDHGSGDYKIVQVGNYIGKNNGKIKLINSDTIELMEIIPNGSYRWLERPMTIKLTKKE